MFGKSKKLAEVPLDAPKQEPKTKEQLKEEYFSLCAKAGNLQYQINVYENDLALIYESIKRVNKEAFDAEQAAKASQTPNQAEKGN